MKMNLSPWKTLSKAWALTKRHFIVMLGLLFAYLVLSVVLSLFNGSAIVTRLLSSLLSLLVAVWFNAGMTKILLDTYNDEEPSFSAFREVAPRVPGLIGQFILMYLCYLIPVVIGFTGLFVTQDLAAFDFEDPYSLIYFAETLPYISLLWVALPALIVLYLYMHFMFATFVYVENPGVGVMEAISRSWCMAKGNLGSIFLCLLLMLVLNIAGLCLFLVGAFLTGIITMFMTVVMYRSLKA